MAKKLSTFLLFVAIFSVVATGRPLKITADNIAQLSNPDGFYIIEAEIEISDTIRVGSGSTLQFVGGCFKGGVLKFSSAYVDAAPYCIFDGTKVDGHFANSTVYADWFGHTGDSDQNVINTALESASDNVVVTGAKSYNLSGPIILQKAATRLKSTATFYLRSETPTIAFDIRSPFVALNINDIQRVKDSAADYARDTAIRFSDTVTNSTINVTNIYNFAKGFDFDYSRSGGLCRYNRLTFQMIRSKEGISLNSAGTPVVANRIVGGRITSDVGLSQNPIADTDAEFLFRSNEYFMIGFELTKKLIMDLDRSSNERFEYARMNESLPTDSIYINIRNTRNLDLMSKGSFASKYINVGTNVTNSAVRQIFGDEYYNYHGLNIMYIDKPLYGPSLNPSVSSTFASANRFGTNVSVPEPNDVDIQVLTLGELCASNAPDTKFLNTTATLNVPSYKAVFIDLAKKTPGGYGNAGNPANLPLILRLKIGDGGKLIVTANDRVPPSTYKIDRTELEAAGTYRLVWSSDWQPMLINLSD